MIQFQSQEVGVHGVVTQNVQQHVVSVKEHEQEHVTIQLQLMVERIVKDTQYKLIYVSKEVVQQNVLSVLIIRHYLTNLILCFKMKLC